MRYAAFRQPVAQQARRRHDRKTFPAPVRGWVTNENLANQGPGSALVLDNWFPTSTGIRVRGGSNKYATLASSAAVVSTWPYVTSSAAKLFAATASSIFDITSIADADTIPTAAVTGQTSGYYSTTQFATAGGNYLYAVNGDDDAQLYDGTSWQAVNSGSTPAITGIATSSLIYVWAFASRLFFIEKDSLNAWYLAVDSIGGAATQFSLAGVFKRGGSLLFGGTWSLDSGDGLDDKCVFVTDQGEVAVYEGIDPGSAFNWSLVGRYDVGEPLGSKATMQAGGDLIIATDIGVVPLSEAVRKDTAALSIAAVSVSIEPDWQKTVALRKTSDWEILKWPSNNMMVVSMPSTASNQTNQCFVANLETGAWCRFTGWDVNCMALHNGVGYFGTSDGLVFQMEVGGNDGGSVYTCSYVGGFDHLGSPGSYKTVLQSRATLRANTSVDPQVSVSNNYDVSLPTAPNSIAEFSSSQWDSGRWDEATWDTGSEQFSIVTGWKSIGASGFAFAPQMQITLGVTPKPEIELVSVDMTYEGGGTVV